MTIKRNKPLRTQPYPSKDLTNKRINRLVVLRFEEYRPDSKGRRKSYYRCKCDCGNEAVISRNELKNGRISCGCALEYFRKNILPKNAREMFSLPDGEASFNALYASYQDRCKRKQMEFEFTKKEFRKITSENCFFCGTKPLQSGRKRNNGSYLHNGIDRIDSSKGYVNGNVLPCCEICNKAKRDLSLDEFLKWINRLIKFRYDNTQSSKENQLSDKV